MPRLKSSSIFVMFDLKIFGNLWFFFSEGMQMGTKNEFYFYIGNLNIVTPKM